MEQFKAYQLLRSITIVQHGDSIYNKFDNDKVIKRTTETYGMSGNKEDLIKTINSHLQYANDERGEIPEKMHPAFPEDPDFYMSYGNSPCGLVYKGAKENSIIYEIYCTYLRCLSNGGSNITKTRKKKPYFTVIIHYNIVEFLTAG